MLNTNTGSKHYLVTAWVAEQYEVPIADICVHDGRIHVLQVTKEQVDDSMHWEEMFGPRQSDGTGHPIRHHPSPSRN